MKQEKSMVIPFTGLKLGEHHYKFEPKDTFFQDFNTPIETGKLIITVLLDKRENMLILDFDIKGAIETPCARCNDLVQHKITTEERLFVKFGAEPFENTDDIVILADNEHEVDITPFVSEFVQLQIPIRIAHQEKDCNQEVLKKLEEFRYKSKDDDPRWDALKNIKLD